VVTYSHGHEDVPDGIVRVACAMVNRVLTAPTATEGLGGETIGQYSYQAPGGSSGVGVYLSKGDMASLRRWRSSAGTIMVRSW
jgi:anti-sigma regulatory factor (Ser/Thr protein kinase)